MDHRTRLEIEAALQSVYFATRHLDQAATVVDQLGLDPGVAAVIATTRFYASASLKGLAECLPAASEVRQIADDAVPF